MGYDQKWHVIHKKESVAAGRSIVGYVARLFRPKSYLELGCGFGHWAKAAQAVGIADILAIDGAWTDTDSLVIDRSLFRSIDIGQCFDLRRSFDLALSVEVAEHLDGSSSGTFVENLTRHADLVVFGAAIPLQGGLRHVNEQWPSYWAAKFREHGFRNFDLIRPRFWSDNCMAYYYRQNTFVYVNGARQDLVQIASTENSALTAPLDIVHPEKFVEVASYDNMHLAQVIKKFPSNVRRAIRERYHRRFGVLKRSDAAEAEE